MKIQTLIVGLALVVVPVAGCSSEEVQTKHPDGVAAAAKDGEKAAPTPVADVPGSPVAPKAAARPEYRDVAVPAGRTLTVELDSPVASDTSSVEDPVRGTLRRSVVVDGVTVIPAGTAVVGHVTEATRSARVKGRARVAFRFTRLQVPGVDDRVTIRTGVVAREAAASKKQDAVKIGGGAAGGAIIGGIVGGGDGAAKGAAIGGAAGTGVVLATRGKEVRLGAGTPIAVKLLESVTVRVRG